MGDGACGGCSLMMMMLMMMEAAAATAAIVRRNLTHAARRYGMAWRSSCHSVCAMLAALAGATAQRRRSLGLQGPGLAWQPPAGRCRWWFWYDNLR